MALKWKLTKTAWGKLSEEMQAEYKLEDGHYILDIDGLPEPEDTGALKRANDRLKADLDDAKEELKTATTELNKIKATQTDGEKDVQRLTATHDKRVKKIQEDADAKVNSLKEKITAKLVTTAAESLANLISTAPKLMLSPIQSRLTVEFGEDDTPVLKVLKDGKPSDMTIDKLAEEFRADKDYKSVIKASQASGGGTTSKVPPLPNTGGTGNEEAKPVNLATAKPGDLVAAMKAKMNANQGAEQ